MGRKLNTYVTVAGVTYAPGEVADEVADLIENESVFDQDSTEAEAEGGEVADEVADQSAKKPVAKKAANSK